MDPIRRHVDAPSAATIIVTGAEAPEAARNLVACGIQVTRNGAFCGGSVRSHVGRDVRSHIQACPFGPAVLQDACSCDSPKEGQSA